jgi:large subunit ribosomal protein L13
MSTSYIPSGKDIKRKWFVVDASGKTLGRLATKAADVLSGKLNPKYTPYIDMGDHVIVINAEKIVPDRPEVAAEALSPLHRLPRRSARRVVHASCSPAAPKRSSSRPSRACCPSPRWAARWPPSSRSTSGDKHPHLAQQPVAPGSSTRNAPPKLLASSRCFEG